MDLPLRSHCCLYSIFNPPNRLLISVLTTSGSFFGTKWPRSLGHPLSSSVQPALNRKRMHKVRVSPDVGSTCTGRRLSTCLSIRPKLFLSRENTCGCRTIARFRSVAGNAVAVLVLLRSLTLRCTFTNIRSLSRRSSVEQLRTSLRSLSVSAASRKSSNKSFTQ